MASQNMVFHQFLAKKGALVLLLIFLCKGMGNAQFNPTPVEVSDQKIINNGKVYYIHTIKKGQTLYSISRAYGVSEKTIASINPNIKLEVIKPGQTLKIPANIENNQSLEESLFGLSKKDFIYHTVKPKQTLYFLHQKYKVPLDLIVKYNPEIENGLKIEQIVRIPKKHIVKNQEPPKKETLPKNKGINYTVKNDDTLYGLAKKYGVNISTIINNNEELRWGLKEGQTIYIPIDTAYYIKDSVQVVPDSSRYLHKIYTKRECDTIRSTRPLNLILMLPFHTAEIATDTLDSLLDNRNKKSNSSIRLKSRISNEIYEGLLLSLDTLKKEGKEVNLFVYDTRSDTNVVKDILKGINFNPDLILGTIYKKNTELVSKFSKREKVVFVPPFINNDIEIKNPYIFMVKPTQETIINKCAKEISKYYNKNIILIYKPSIRNFDYINLFKETLFDHFSSRSQFDSAVFKEVHLDESFQHNLNLALRDDVENIIIAAADKEAEASIMLTKLNNIDQDSIKIRVYGKQVMQKFKNIPIQHIHDIGMIIYAPFFIDYNDEDVLRFVAKCRNSLKHEPYKTSSDGSGINFTFLGYDMGYFFIDILTKYNNKACNCISHYAPDLLLSRYNFVQHSGTGYFENQSINFIQYTKDYTIKKLDINP